MQSSFCTPVSVSTGWDNTGDCQQVTTIESSTMHSVLSSTVLITIFDTSKFSDPFAAPFGRRSSRLQGAWSAHEQKFKISREELPHLLTISPTRLTGGGSPNLVDLVEGIVPVERKMGAANRFHSFYPTQYTCVVGKHFVTYPHVSTSFSLFVM